MAFVHREDRHDLTKFMSKTHIKSDGDVSLIHKPPEADPGYCNLI